jgi:hypothetical protein
VKLHPTVVKMLIYVDLVVVKLHPTVVKMLCGFSCWEVEYCYDDEVVYQSRFGVHQSCFIGYQSCIVGYQS